MSEPAVAHLPLEALAGLAIACSCGGWSLLRQNRFGRDADEAFRDHQARATAEPRWAIRGHHADGTEFHRAYPTEAKADRHLDWLRRTHPDVTAEKITQPDQVAAAEQRGYQRAIDALRDRARFEEWMGAGIRSQPAGYLINGVAADYLESQREAPCLP